MSRVCGGGHLDQGRDLLLTILDAAHVDSKQNATLAIKWKAPAVPVIEVVVHERSDATMTQIELRHARVG